MATESKKLQTYLTEKGGVLVPNMRLYQQGLQNDARIAHEQRKVIRQASIALNLLIEAMEDGTPQEQVEAENAAQEALAAAAPFLED